MDNNFGFGYDSNCDWETLPIWLQNVAQELPHGSGIDYDWTFEFLKNGKVLFHNAYHGMDEYGYYRTSIDFTVKIDPKRPLDFTVVFHAKNRYWVKYWDLENYIPEMINGVVYKHTPVRVPCKHCHGQGFRTVMELAEIRKELPSVTLDMLRMDKRTNLFGVNSLTPEKAKFVCWTCNGSGQVKA